MNIIINIPETFVLSLSLLNPVKHDCNIQIYVIVFLCVHFFLIIFTDFLYHSFKYTPTFTPTHTHTHAKTFSRFYIYLLSRLHFSIGLLITHYDESIVLFSNGFRFLF